MFGNSIRNALNESRREYQVWGVLIVTRRGKTAAWSSENLIRSALLQGAAIDNRITKGKMKAYLDDNPRLARRPVRWLWLRWGFSS